MPNQLIEFSQAILKLNKEKKFGDALKYFKENKIIFSPDEISSNPFLISSMITALRQTNNIDKAFRFLEIYNISINEETPEIILSSYGWLLYDKYKSENHLKDNHEHETESFEDDELNTQEEHNFTDKSETVRLIEVYIPLILKYDTTYTYTVFSRLFNIIPKVEKKKANANWKIINELCDKIPVERLKTDCESREVERKGKKVQMEFASDKENWFAYKSKALMKLRLFQECFDVSSKALETFQKFHYSNDVWFTRRMALAKRQFGNPEDTLQELLQVLKRKKEWFIEKEIAELYKEKGDLNNAFKYAIQAIINFGDLEYKVDLLFLLGELLNLKNEKELAFKHYSLARLIRISEGWNIPAKLSSSLNQFRKENLSIDKFPELKTELKKYWNSFNQQSEQKVLGHTTNRKQTGKIDKILHNDERGADGFIKCEESKSVYFKVNSNEEIKTKLKIGLEVEFKILPATIDKKEKAVNLKLKTK